MSSAPSQDTPKGFVLALTAYLMWGGLPLYLRLLSHIPAPEVIVHRVIWSVPVAGLVLIVLGRTADLRRALATPRVLAMALLTAGLITVNWGVYVWAIAADRTLDAALGYYINPLFSILLGALVLKERLSKAQIVAIVLASLAVALLTYENGSLPWVALVLTLSWGVYAFFRKTLPVGANQGFMLEVLILTPFALGYMIWLEAHGQSHFLISSGTNTRLLMGCGLVTAVPLMFYGNGAKLLRLSTIGIMQYIVPTILFLLAVFVFDEPISPLKMVAFGMIWTALVLYTGSMLQAHRRG